MFVNQPAARIEEIDAAVGLDLLQLHGDEQRTLVAAFAPRVLKVMRFSGAPERSAFAAFPDVWGFLVEGRSANAYGGVGQRWDYAAARGLAARELALTQSREKYNGLELLYDKNQWRNWPFLDFISVLARLLGRKGGLASFSAHELEGLKKFYNRTPGLTEALLREAIERAPEKTIPYIAYEIQRLHGRKED